MAADWNLQIKTREALWDGITVVDQWCCAIWSRAWMPADFAGLRKINFYCRPQLTVIVKIFHE